MNPGGRLLKTGRAKDPSKAAAYGTTRQSVPEPAAPSETPFPWRLGQATRQPGANFPAVIAVQQRSKRLRPDSLAHGRKGVPQTESGPEPQSTLRAAARPRSHAQTPCSTPRPRGLEAQPTPLLRFLATGVLIVEAKPFYLGASSSNQSNPGWQPLPVAGSPTVQPYTFFTKVSRTECKLQKGLLRIEKGDVV